MEHSLRHRFIFVHVYRAGGQSISAALAPHADAPRRRFPRVPVLRRLGASPFAELHDHRYGHPTAKQMKDALPAEIFDGFFKFAFVRNPWDWQVSVYHYITQRAEHPDHAFYTSSFRTFDDYLDWRVNHEGPELQSDFVRGHSGEVLVNFIGHFETLARDFATVCDRLGIEATLPHKNRSTHRDYTEHYTPRTRALVADAYRDDIRFFGYEFGSQAKLPPITANL